MDTEAFIRSRAKMGWSKKMVYEALGISDQKSRAIFAAMPDIVWPGRNDSVGRQMYYASKRGSCSPAQRRAILGAVEVSAKKRRLTVTICGQVLSVYEVVKVWAGYIDVTARHILWRKRQGQSDYEAVFSPKRQSAIGQKKGPWHDSQLKVNTRDDHGQMRAASTLLQK